METTYTQSSDMSCGVPQRREKRFGNGVKNLSGSADLPEWLVMEPAKRRLAWTLNDVFEKIPSAGHFRNAHMRRSDL
jgi:hypothetical protein